MQNALNTHEEVGGHPFAHRIVENGEEIFIDFASPKIAERLRGTEFDSNGQVFLLSLDALRSFLGDKWRAKRPVIIDYVNSTFERNISKPNWCMEINDTAFIFAMPTFLPRQGARESARILQSVMRFFIGQIDNLELPIFEVAVNTISKLRIKRLSVEIYADIIDNGANIPTNNSIKEVSDAGRQSELSTNSSSKNGISSNIGIRVEVENFIQLKNMGAIGHRVKFHIYDLVNNQELNSKAASALSQFEREQIDKIGVEMAIGAYNDLPKSMRKVLFIVPVSFSTLTSISARTKIIGDMSNFANANGLKAIIEIHDLANVPQYRIVEQIAFLKSQNIAVVGDSITDQTLMQDLIKSRIDGFSIEYTGLSHNKNESVAYIKSLQQIVKSAHGFLFMYGFNNPKEIEVARISGFGHVACGLKSNPNKS